MLSDLHNHSTFTDGINTCEELVEQAITLGVQRIGLVEHVGRKSEWVSDFIDTANRLKERYDGEIQIVTGLEAKALNCAGEIDVKDMWIDKVDYILGAIHRIPSRSNQFYSASDMTLNKSQVLEDWLSTIQGIIKNDMVDIVAHPAAELIRYKIPLDNQTMTMLGDLGEKFGKVFEVNVKHRAPVQAFLTHLIDKKIPFSIGSDSHSTVDQQIYIKDIISIHKAMASCRLF